MTSHVPICRGRVGSVNYLNPTTPHPTKSLVTFDGFCTLTEIPACTPSMVGKSGVSETVETTLGSLLPTLEGGDHCVGKPSLTEDLQVRTSLPSSFCHTLNETNKLHLVHQLHVADGQHHLSSGSGAIHADPLGERRSRLHLPPTGLLLVDRLIFPNPVHLKSSRT